MLHGHVCPHDLMVLVISAWDAIGWFMWGGVSFVRLQLVKLRKCDDECGGCE